jgi:hypothetical protein
VIKTKDQESKQQTAGYYQGVDFGASAKQKRVLEQIKSRICFDNKGGRGCEHSSCFSMRELFEEIQDDLIL